MPPPAFSMGPSMRRSFLYLAGVLFVAAVVLVALFFSTTVSAPIGPGSPLTTQSSGLEMKLGAVHATVAWTGGNGSGTLVAVFACGSSSSCVGANQSAALAIGHGSSGTLSFSLDPGHYYSIQSNVPVTVIVAAGELAGLFELGVALGVVGLVLLILGMILDPPKPSASSHPATDPTEAPRGTRASVGSASPP